MSERAIPSRLAILAHEVRSPAAALAAIRETLDAQRIEPEDRAELVRLVLAACTAIERIVTDASLSVIDRQPVDVVRLLRETAAAAELRGGRVRVLDAAPLSEVSLDAVRIRQALDNLVENALAHTTPGGEVLLAVQIEDEDLLLSVSDSGPGIPEAEQERIFEPGVRLGSAYPGSGLGLAVVRTIAEAHGGRVAVRSRPGEETAVTLVLPLQQR